VSVAIPKAAVVFGEVTPPQGDIQFLFVHLGCTKEVSSFECLLQNWNKKYSQGGSSPITEGMHGHIDIGRGSNVPQIITCRVENAECESLANEHYIRLTGRCWGERIFRRVVVKTYENKKGESIIRDLVDYYIGLDHCRENSALSQDASSGQKDCVVADGSKFSAGMLIKIKDDNAWEYNEVSSVLGNTVSMVNNLANTYTVAANGKVWIDLIEKTDTTYTKLECDETPVFDVLKYITGSADKGGVIGYDFRVAPDGKFEFFPKNSKTSPVTVTDTLEHIKYGKDIHRIRNKIIVRGLADKSVPADKDAWTESLTPDDGAWSAAAGEISLDTTFKAKGSASIKVHSVSMYWVGAIFTLNAGKEVNSNLYPILSFLAYLEKSYNGNVSVMLYDQTDKTAGKNITVAPGKWRKTDLKVGLANEVEWTDVDAGFDWSNIKKVRIDGWFSGVGSGDFWIDQLYFGGRRYSAVREDVASQEEYTDGEPRELVEVDEELISDNECDLRAKALLDYLKGPAEYVKVIRTTVLDYGNTPLLPGDKIPVILPNENVDSYFRTDNVEYYVYPAIQTLEIVADLGKVPPLLADYMYGLRATTVTVEKLARTKLGKGAIPTALGGGLGAHHVGHEAGDDNGVPWPTDDDGGWDKITGWVCPRHIGPYEDEAAIVKFRTKNKAGTGVLDHQFQPSDDEHGVLGSATAKWKEVHTLYLLLYTDGYMQIKTYGESNPKAKFDKEMLQFGPGGATALDTWLKRVGSGQLELKTELWPVSDNSGKIGTSAKSFAEINGYQYGIKGNMIPASDNASNLGAADKRFAHIYAVEIHVSNMLFNFHLLPDADATYDLGASNKKWKDLYLSGAIKALDAGVAVHLLPNATATYDLGSSAKKWSNLYVAGVGYLGSLNVADYEVITAARVLQNVTAAANIITSGRFPLARLPEGASGYVLEAEGGGFDPMYVDPNYRYEPKSHPHSEHTGIGPNDHHAQVHNHGGESISPNAVSCNVMSIASSCNKQYSHPSGQQCVYATSIAWEYCPHYGCVNYSAGDLCMKKGMRIPFINGMAITEAESLGLGPGFAFLNRKGKVIMVLDEDGNIEISGKIKEGVAA